MAKAQQLEENDLIDRIKTTNDPYWFGVLYDKYAPKAFNKCLMLLKNNADAEDATHDIFLKVFINLKHFKGNSLFSTWFYAITYNFCISFLRKKKAFVELTENNEIIEEDEIEDKEFLKLRIIQLEWALQEITTEEKIILLMKYQDDMSIRDIMETLNLGESAVKMRIKRAKNKVASLCANNKTL